MLLQKIQPLADRFAEAMLTCRYSESLVWRSLSSPGGIMVRLRTLRLMTVP